MYFEALASGGGSDWYYTILMKAPLGAKITVDDGDEEVEATGAGMDTIIGIPVHNDSSTYTVSVEMNGLTAPTSSITTPATSGGISSVVEVPFAKISLTYDDEFRGQSMSMTDGTHSASVTLPALGNTIDIYVPYTGNWTLEATDPVSGNQFNSSPNPVPVVSLDQTINAGLFVIPDGKTVLPTDDIETWLLCADIKDVSYTTLAEVLADEDVLRRLLTDDNAIDYLKRSTEWIKNDALVPILTGPTSSIIASANAQTSGTYGAWQAFDGQDGNNKWVDVYMTGDIYIGYVFSTAKIVRSVKVTNETVIPEQGVQNCKIEYSDDGTTWLPASAQFVVPQGGNITVATTESSAHTHWRLLCLSNHGGANAYTVLELQFYSRADEGITGNETAMSYIGAYDYAAETLLSDSDWCDGIFGSEYSDKVTNVQIPAMTTNTEPSGEASANEGTAYLAFNNPEFTKTIDYHSANSWVTNGQANKYLQYKFDVPVKIFRAKVRGNYYSGQYGNAPTIKNYTIQNEQNGSFVDVSDVIEYPNTSGYISDAAVNSSVSSDTWRFNFVDCYSATYIEVANAQLIGRQVAGVQTLLKAAGVARPYTTLDELLADKEALATVIGSHAAIDYLVTVKDWIDEFTSDETAMLFIGGDNYAADTLISDEDWVSGIAASAYVDYVLNAKVPTMSSDTAPSGKVFYQSQNSSYPAYRAFNNTKNWTTNAGQTPPMYIGYIFEAATTLKYLYCTEWGYSSGGFISNFIVQGSNDTTNGADGTWTDLSDATTFPSTGASAPHSLVINNNTAYKAYRLCSTTATVGSAGSIQFYCRDDVTEGVHIFSAASDTIYDQNNQVVATTDTTGHALIDKANLPNGTYTLRSTVAKDPDDLSNDFTKVVEVTDATKAIFLMPDNTLYWYGYSDSDMEICSTANGWATGHGSYSLIDPTFNANSVVCDVPAYKVAGYGTKTAKDYDNATAHLIDKTADTDQIFMYSTVKNNMLQPSYVLVAEGGNVMKHQTATINGAALYLAFYAGFQGAAVYKTMYALWIE